MLVQYHSHRGSRWRVAADIGEEILQQSLDPTPRPHEGYVLVDLRVDHAMRLQRSKIRELHVQNGTHVDLLVVRGALFSQFGE